MDRVVVGYDYSPYARRALGLALQGFPFGAKTVEILHACDERIFQEGLPSSDIPTVERLEGFIQRDVDQIRSEMPAGSSIADVSVVIDIAAGRAGDQILKRMEVLGDAALYLGGQGHGGLGERFLGRTANRILRKATFPVYVVKDGSGGCEMGATVLSAIDYAKPSRSALRAASLIARETEKKLAVVHVVDNPYIPYLHMMDADPEDDSALRELLEGAPEELTAFVEGELGEEVAYSSEVLFGAISERIAEHATAVGAGIVVVASHGHGALGRVVMGSVAEGLVQKAAVDVLVVRSS